jgi:RNA polymerase sigma factor (sigma-70 family)
MDSESALKDLEAAPLHLDEALDAAEYLNSLPPREREILKLRMEGEDFQEIADRLSTKPANVRQWFHRAFRKGVSFK